jgi:hypothetical protein
MKLAIMQPYIFPYIGYFQLLSAVDTFVIYDDVNFIKQGWINRNQILLNGKVYRFNIILKDSSSFRKINEIEINCNNQKLIATIEQAYRKAPFFNIVFPLVTNILQFNETNLAKFLTNSILTTVSYLNIKLSVLISSEIKKNCLLKGENKVIDICKQLNATSYINTIGGLSLYSKEMFLENNLTLKFIKPRLIEYHQFSDKFIPWLSIIDVMMFNSPAAIGKMLTQY